MTFYGYRRLGYVDSFILHHWSGAVSFSRVCPSGLTARQKYFFK